MEIKENTKTNWFNKFLLEKSGAVGITLMAIVFISTVPLYWIFHKITVDLMYLIQIGSVVMILFFILIDIQHKLDKIEKNLNCK